MVLREFLVTFDVEYLPLFPVDLVRRGLNSKFISFYFYLYIIWLFHFWFTILLSEALFFFFLLTLIKSLGDLSCSTCLD